MPTTGAGGEARWQGSARAREIERLRSATAVNGGRLNPWVQVGTPRGIWVSAGGAANDAVSDSRLALRVGTRQMVIGSTLWPA